MRVRALVLLDYPRRGALRCWSSASGRSVPDSLSLERGATLSSAIAQELDQNGRDYFAIAFCLQLYFPFDLLCNELTIRTPLRMQRIPLSLRREGVFRHVAGNSRRRGLATHQSISPVCITPNVCFSLALTGGMLV
jgi:hypothetical protein